MSVLSAIAAIPLSMLAGVPSAGEVCLEATPITCGTSFTYDNSLTSGGWDEIDLNATTLEDMLDENLCIGNVNEPNRNTYWFRFVAQDTTAVLSTCASVGTDSSMQVYSGSCGGLTQVGCSEASCSSTSNSRVYLEGLSIGATYYVQVGSWDDVAAGNYTLELTCAAPDCVACPIADPVLVIDNDGPCQFEDYYLPGPLTALYTGNGQDNNYGCEASYQPQAWQVLPLPNVVCGTMFHSASSTVLGFGRDVDTYVVYTPTDTNGLPTEELHMTFAANQPCIVEVRWDETFCTDLLSPAPIIYYFDVIVTDTPCTPNTVSMDILDGQLLYVRIGLPNRDFRLCESPTGILPNDLGTKYSFSIWWDCVPCPDVYIEDGTGLVDLNDLSLVLFNFGEVSATPGIAGDADCDGDVDLDDLSTVLFAFGTTPGC